MHIDYSKSKYVAANGMSLKNPTYRYITHVNEDGEEVIHFVNIETHPEELLPGGSGMTKKQKADAKPVETAAPVVKDHRKSNKLAKKLPKETPAAFKVRKKAAKRPRKGTRVR